MLPAPLPFSAKARRTREQPISFLMQAAVTNPDVISLAAGLVDQATLPTREVWELTQKLLSDPARGRAALQYGTTRGDAELRRLALDHVCTLDGTTPAELALTPEHVVVTTGSQQALYLLAEVLLDPSDIVIAADPSYFVYTGTLESFGARVRYLPMDGNGLRVDLLDGLFAELDANGELDKVKLVYCTSYYQNPTGLTLAAQRRPLLLDTVRKWSRTQRIVILEDAAYRELWYDAPPPPTVKSFEKDNVRVAASFTFSKPFAPGIKTGFAVLPGGLVDPVLQQKGNHDFGSPNLCQQLAAEALRSGAYHAHAELLRATYKRKRDAMLEALDEHLPAGHGTTWVHPHGGLYVWLTLPPHVDANRPGAFFDACVAAGVLYVPGSYCRHPRGDGKPTPSNDVRLSFGHASEERVREGVRRFAGVVKRST